MQRFLWGPREPQEFHPCQRSYFSTLKKQSRCQEMKIRVCSSSDSGSDRRINCFGNSVKVRFWFPWWHGTAQWLTRNAEKNYVPSVGIQTEDLSIKCSPRNCSQPGCYGEGTQKGDLPCHYQCFPYTEYCPMDMHLGEKLQLQNITGQSILFSFF